MTGGQLLFVLLVAAMAVAIGAAAWRADKVLGRLVVSGLLVYMAGGFAMGAYLREVKGRTYLAPDEAAYQIEGALIARGWRTHNPWVPGIAGGWPYVNAAVISLWGPSQAPLRMLNALAGGASIAAAYALALVLFASPTVARTAAAMVLVSPSLFLWAMTNLKERMLGLMVAAALAAAVLIARRWTWPRWLLLLAALFLLGELRHYYAAIIGWLSIAAFALFGTPPWRRRVMPAIVLLVSVGFVLQAVSGTFLATSMTQETVVRYVPIDPNELPEGMRSDYSALGTTTGHAEATPKSFGDLARSLWFVLAGRFESRLGAGRAVAALTWPEWLANFALLPIVIWMCVDAVRRRDVPLTIVAAFLGGMVLLLTWTHGDDWSTFRFRAVYWPAYLTVAAPGIARLCERYAPGVFRPLVEAPAR